MNVLFENLVYELYICSINRVDVQKNKIILHATIHTTSFGPGIVSFCEFLPVKKCFDFQNQMQPQFCKSTESGEMDSEKTNSSCQAQARAPTRNGTSSFLTSCGTTQGCPVCRNDSQSLLGQLLNSKELQNAFFHIICTHDLLSPTVFR